jgi:hypothetical protein
MNSPARPQFGAVVLNYRDRLTTRNCIDSILALESPPQQIVLVDNVADAGSIAFFAKLYQKEPRIRRFHFKDNRGYTGGNNIGIAYLLAQEVDLICLLNNDTLILPGFFDRLTECFISGTRPDIVTPLILYEDGKTIWSAGERTCYPLLISRSCRGRVHDSGMIIRGRPNSVTGCAMAVRRQVFQKIGLLDDAYFAYVEDVDFCKRATDSGFRVALCPQARALHLVSKTAGHLSPAQLYLKSRNRAYFIRKNIPRVFWAAAFAWYLGLNCVWATKLLAHRQYRSVQAIAYGMADWKSGRMGAGRVAGFLGLKKPSATEHENTPLDTATG